jgi:hypothetical protein
MKSWVKRMISSEKDFENPVTMAQAKPPILLLEKEKARCCNTVGTEVS